jgi:hypothetical protein
MKIPQGNKEINPNGGIFKTGGSYGKNGNKGKYGKFP